MRPLLGLVVWQVPGGAGIPGGGRGWAALTQTVTMTGLGAGTAGGWAQTRIWADLLLDSLDLRGRQEQRSEGLACLQAGMRGIMGTPLSP